MINEQRIPDWNSFNHDTADFDDDIIFAEMESRIFDFRFLDDDDDDDDDHNVSEDCSCAAEDHEVSAIANADDYTSTTSSCGPSCCCTGTTSMESSQQSIFTERSDDTTFTGILEEQQQHSPDCRCMQLSPFSMSSSLPISSTSVLNYDTMPHFIGSDPRWTHPNSMPSQLNEKINEDYSWCIEAASRVMISVEVHGKLLMRLREQQQVKVQPQKSRRSYSKKQQTNPHPLPPKGWMTYQQLIQQVPKLQRILGKTSMRFIDQKGILRSCSGNTPHNSTITPLQVMYVLQRVNGVRIMPCPGSNDCFYYSIDWTWLSSTLDPKLGYNPSSGNIVLQLVQQRLLRLLDDSPTGRYCTNEIGHIYEVTFHEPLLFKPLGYGTFKALINELPSLERIHDNCTFGPNGIQWYIRRATIKQ